MNLKFKCKNNIERVTLVLKLKDLGWGTINVDWDSASENFDFEEYPYVNIDDETDETPNIYLISKDYTADNGTPIKEVKKLKDILIKYEKRKEIKVTLNSQYIAIVKKDHVKVGCQTFSFEKVEELYNAIEEYKKK